MATDGAKLLYGGVFSWDGKKVLAGLTWTMGGFFCGLSLALSAFIQSAKVIRRNNSSSISPYSPPTLVFLILIGLASAIAHISIILIPGLLIYLFRNFLTPLWVIVSLILLAMMVGEFTSGRNKVIIKILGEDIERRLNPHRSSHAKSIEPDPIDLSKYFRSTPAEITESALDEVFGKYDRSNTKGISNKNSDQTTSRRLSTDEANNKLEQIKKELEKNN
ncbi:hypothetical protein [Haloarcula halophila]|uniref:hypothetical protein n=1 Tax=Haloarcula TaxID=2237 RepID=UPI0023E3F05A|nr:hypothetical protein [Halomicroarcula sp. DFY41]